MKFVALLLLLAQSLFAESLKHDGLDREYLVHVPKSYDKSKPTPLLLAIHGGAGSMKVQATDRYYKMISTSEKYGFIAVFPDGYRRLLSSWNAGKCCGAARDKNIDDVGFIRKLIQEVSSQYNIDSKRIFSTGMSNGAMLSYRLACEMPDVISGVAAVAGTDNTTTCTPSKPISILHIHAKDDDHVQFNGGAGPGALIKRAVTDYVSVPNTIEKWVKLNGCAPSPKRTLTVAGAYCDEYSGCKDNVKVKLCVTETGKHSWPGGVNPLRGEPSTSISASEVLSDFFTLSKN